jgi:uncharacterized membrane protein
MTERKTKAGQLARVAALNVDVAAAEQNIDGLADAVQKSVWGKFDGTDAIEFLFDEERTFVAHGALEVALTLLFGAAGNLCALLAQMKAGGAELLGHQ